MCEIQSAFLKRERGFYLKADVVACVSDSTSVSEVGCDYAGHMNLIAGVKSNAGSGVGLGITGVVHQ